MSDRQNIGTRMLYVLSRTFYNMIFRFFKAHDPYMNEQKKKKKRPGCFEECTCQLQGIGHSS